MSQRTVLITGASSGYGLAAAKLFAAAGDTVILAARRKEQLLAAQKEVPGSIIFPMDVTKISDWQICHDFITANFKELDILINNAGGGIRIDYLDRLTPEEINEVITLNLTSVIYGCHTFMDIFKNQRHGTIVNISSISARYNWETWTVYGAAKAGVANFSKGLYTELQPYGVRVSCLYPALTATGFQKAAHTDEAQGTLQAEHVADTIFYACNLPEGVVLQDISVWGTDQSVQPL